MIVQSTKNAVSERTFVSDVPSGKFCTIVNPFSCMVNRMIHPHTTNQETPVRATNGPARLPSAVISLAVAAPEPSSIHPTDPDQTPPLVMDARLVDQSGRPLGTRALRTRARILEATVSLLNEKALRELRVIDIARRIGSSPATFYQYFKDVRDVVLELATEVSESNPDLVEVIDGDWTGRDGFERGCRLANLVIEYWEEYSAILRIRNNAADEGEGGDSEFAQIRLQAMMPMVMAFAKIISANSSQDRPRVEDASNGEWAGGPIHPVSASMVMVSGLEAMALHCRRFEKRFAPMGEGREEIVQSMASMMQLVLTAKH